MLLALVLSLACCADEPDLKWVDAVAERALATRPNKALEADLKAAQLQLRSAKSAKVVRGGRTERETMILQFPDIGWTRYKQFATKEDKEKAIGESDFLVNQRTDRLKNGSPSEAPELPREQPRVGYSGTVWDGRVRVLQIVDGKAAIVQMIRGTTNSSSGLDTVTFWLETDTSSWSDKTLTEFKLPVLFTGNKQYSTVDGGTKTVLVARHWTEAELQRFKSWKPTTKKK